VPVDGEVDPPRHLLDGVLELVVLEGGDRTAPLADQVVMVLAAGVRGLVSGHALAHLEALHQLHAVEQLERPVDARQTDAGSPLPDEISNLPRGHGATLPPERLDHGNARPARAVAGALQRTQGVCDPILSGPRAHRGNDTHPAAGGTVVD
jgi:hypothetical protein